MSVAATAGGGEGHQPEDLKELERARDRLQKDLVQIERQIFDLEETYLEETVTTGNVLMGWDVVLSDGLKGKYVKKDTTKRLKEERLFTLSSVTAPSFGTGRRSLPAAVGVGGAAATKGEGAAAIKGEAAGLEDGLKSKAAAAGAGETKPPPKKRGRPPNPNKYLTGDKKKKS